MILTSGPSTKFRDESGALKRARLGDINISDRYIHAIAQGLAVLVLMPRIQVLLPIDTSTSRFRHREDRLQSQLARDGTSTGADSWCVWNWK
jgi:hypothetical protein